MNSRKAPDASKMSSFVRTTSACRSKNSRVLDLQAALREAPRVLDGRSGPHGSPGVPPSYELVDDVSLRSFNATFSRIIPQAQLLVCQGPDFTVHVTDLFGDGVIATVQLQEPLVDALSCYGRLYFIYRAGVTAMNLETRARDFLNLQVTDSLSCQCSAGALEVQRALGPAMLATHDSPITAAAATTRRVFLADVRGKISEISWITGLPVIKVLSNKIRDVLLGRREKIVQLAADPSRDLLFSLSESGVILAYNVSNEQFKQVRGSITEKDVISIHGIPSSMSASICLCSADSHGRTNFYTLNDQISSHFTEIGVTDPIEAVELRKCFSDKIGPAERIQCLGLRVQAGRFFYLGSDQVEYFGVDQSISKQNKPFALSGSLGSFAAGNEVVLDVRCFPHRLPFTTPTMGVEYEEVQAYQFEKFQSQKFIGVVTNQRILIYAELKLQEMVKRMFLRSQAEAIREFLNSFLDEVDFIELTLAISCDVETPGVGELVQLERRCLIQFVMQDGVCRNGILAPNSGSGGLGGAWSLLEDCARFRPAIFLQAAQQLLQKMLMPVFSYQLFYSPFNYFQQKVEAGRHEIPVRNLLVQQKRVGTAQAANPVVLFSYLELFNLGVAVSHFTQVLERFLPLLAKVQPFGVSTAATAANSLFNAKGGAQSGDDLSCADLCGCSVYVKELLYFFSLCFNPQNAARVVPELMQLSNNTQTGQTELPMFQFGYSSQKQQNQGLYVTTPALTFQYYLDSGNKHDMEVLVRKLNLILNQQQTNAIFRLNQKAYQESFDRVFSTMCKYLSKIYVSRLQALQELEQASLARGQRERGRRVSAAVKQLKSARSLAPVEPLLEVFAKADAVKDLVTLMLHTYDGQLQQLNTTLKRTNFSSLYSDFQAQTLRFKALYNQQAVSYAFSMNQGVQVPPYTLEPLLASGAIQDAISGVAQQFRADLTQGTQPETTALREAADVLQHVFALIQTHFVYQGLNAILNGSDGANIAHNGKEHQLRGLSVVLAAVQGNTTELWHILLYEFIYLHYIAANCYLDLAQKKQQAVRDGGKAVIQCFTIIQQRCQAALVDIRSPYIEQFLLSVDYELYIRQMRKQRRYSQMLVFIKQILENGTTQAILPNNYENGVFSTQAIDFQQSLQLIQLACTVSKYDGPASDGLTGTSIFNASTAVASAGTSLGLGSSMGASSASQEQFRDYFGKQLELAGVQELLLERLRQQGAEREAIVASKQLWSPVQLQQRLEEARAPDLHLILQYNVVRRLHAHQFSDTEVGMLYDQLFAQTPGHNVQVGQPALSRDAERLLFVLNMTHLDAVTLKLPVYKLISAHLGLFQQDPEQASTVIVAQLFKPSGTQRPYKYVGNFARATMLLLQDYKNNGALAEAIGWLALRLVEASRSITVQAADDEQLAPGRVLERIRQVCPTAPRLQAALRKLS